MSWTGKKGNVVFSKPEAPSFLKEFKEKVGYKEDSGVSDKFQAMPKATAEDLEDGDDELPQVVQLQPGDLSQEEFEATLVNTDAEVKNKSEEEDDRPAASGDKILFRPPAKRSREEGFEPKASTKKAKNKPPTETETEEKGVDTKIKKKKKADRKLLSFDDEEDED